MYETCWVNENILYNEGDIDSNIRWNILFVWKLKKNSVPHLHSQISFYIHHCGILKTNDLLLKQQNLLRRVRESFLRIWSYLLKKPLMGNFICCAVNAFLYLNDIHNIQIKTDKNNEIEHIELLQWEWVHCLEYCKWRIKHSGLN